MTMACQRPWYYVHGRKDITEKRIAQKREKEDNYRRVWNDNDHYFNKCDTQCKLFKQWNDQKSMIKYQTGKRDAIQSPPYDTEPKETHGKMNRPKNKSKEYNDTCRKLAKLLDESRKLDANAVNLRKYDKSIAHQLTQLNNTIEALKVKREFWRLKENRLFYVRFGRDKLRQKAFIICDMLNYYKISIECLRDVHIGEGILNDDEIAQIEDVNDSAVKIIQMYLQINQKRDTEFQLLYHEEGERRWMIQEPEWNGERQVWDTLIDKLIDSYTNILCEKLQENVSQQETLLTQRERNTTELSNFVHKIKRNQSLSGVLYEDAFACISSTGIETPSN